MPFKKTSFFPLYVVYVDENFNPHPHIPHIRIIAYFAYAWPTLVAITMKRVRQAEATFTLANTSTTEPSCPTALNRTKRNERNRPRFHACNSKAQKVGSIENTALNEMHLVHIVLLL